MDVDNKPKFNLIKHKIRRNRKQIVYSILIICIFYFILKILFKEDIINYHLDPFYDGITSKGYGIIKGGTGFSGFQENHRVSGAPPSTRNKDINTFDYIDFQFENTETYSSNNKIIIVLGANLEGGVNKWKGPNEWSIERSSILNKKQYAVKHNYQLVIKDFTKSKKYSNENREGWQKFDIIKEVMNEVDNGDWIWYLDLYSLIMEQQIKLEDLIFNQLDKITTRDLSYFNPNGIDLDLPFLEKNDQPINLIISQDCGGFNLDSFLIKKTNWSNYLLDILFDPIIYLKNFSRWKNGEKNALEYYYSKYASIRSRIAFMPTRLISSLPKGACPDYPNDERFFYNETSRDFLVNMNGCQFYRNCWEEMEYFKNLKTKLHRSWFNRWF